MINGLVGFLLGIIIGVVSGVITLGLLKSIAESSIEHVKSLGLITSQFMAIPTFMFGGPWVTSEWLKLVPLSDLLLPYVAALAAVFVLIVVWPMYRWILRLATELGETAGQANE